MAEGIGMEGLSTEVLQPPQWFLDMAGYMQVQCFLYASTNGLHYMHNTYSVHEHNLTLLYRSVISQPMIQSTDSWCFCRRALNRIPNLSTHKKTIQLGIPLILQVLSMKSCVPWCHLIVCY